MATPKKNCNVKEPKRQPQEGTKMETIGKTSLSSAPALRAPRSQPAPGLRFCAPMQAQTSKTLKWDFPKIRGTLFGGPYNKDPTIKGTILGSPMFGNPQMLWAWSLGRFRVNSVVSGSLLRV